MEYGMSDKLGPMQFGSSQGQVFLGRDIGHEQNYSDAIAYEIDQEMQSFINDCYTRAKNLLTEKSKEVHLIAQTLLTEETLELEQIKRLIESGTIDGSGEGGSNDSNGEPKAEPIIDTIGGVKVRIQTKESGDIVPPADPDGGDDTNKG
jgi:cell division protease FtsH